MAGEELDDLRDAHLAGVLMKPFAFEVVDADLHNLGPQVLERPDQAIDGIAEGDLAIALPAGLVGGDEVTEAGQLDLADDLDAGAEDGGAVGQVPGHLLHGEIELVGFTGEVAPPGQGAVGLVDQTPVGPGPLPDRPQRRHYALLLAVERVDRLVDRLHEATTYRLDRRGPRTLDRARGQYPGPVPVRQVLLAAPRGFCAGVEMAIKALAWMVRAFEPPVYCYHEIVHNQLVVRRFEDLGVVFVDDVAEVPPGAPIMLSAHGSAPEVVAAAEASGGTVVDAVCPLVTKVHHEVKVRAGKGYQIVYVGHDGHEEAVGTMAVAPDSIHRVEHPDDVAALPEFGDPVALLAQTTLSHRDWEDVLEATKDRYPDMWMPGRSDLCFATTNRQSALMEIASRCDSVVVIGSANSSNTVALAKLAADAGCRSVHRVNGADELPPDLEGVVGVTAGASAPEELVEAVIAALAPAEGVVEVSITDEDEYFPPPRSLRDLLGAIDAVATLALGGSPAARPPVNDRQLHASDVLATLD